MDKPDVKDPADLTFSSWNAALVAGELVNGLHECAQWTGVHNAEHCVPREQWLASLTWSQTPEHVLPAHGRGPRYLSEST